MCYHKNNGRRYLNGDYSSWYYNSFHRNRARGIFGFFYEGKAKYKVGKYFVRICSGGNVGGFYMVTYNTIN